MTALAKDQSPDQERRGAGTNGPQFKLQLRLPVKPEEAFDLLIDPNRRAKLLGQRGMRRLDDGPIRVGSRWASSALFGLVHMMSKVTACDRPRRYVKQAHGSFEATSAATFTPDGDGCRVDLSVAYTRIPFLCSAGSLQQRDINHYKALAETIANPDAAPRPPPQPTAPRKHEARKTVLIWAVLILMFVSIYMMFTEGRGEEVSFARLMEIVERTPRDLTASSGDPHLEITVDAEQGEAKYAGKFANTDKAFHARGPIHLGILADLKRHDVRYQIKKDDVPAGQAVVLLCGQGAQFLLLCLIAVALYRRSQRLFEPPLLLRHRLVAVGLTMLGVGLLLVGVGRIAGQLAVTRAAFVARPNTAVIGRATVFASPVRFLLSPPSRGGIILALSEQASDAGPRPHDAALRLVGDEGVLVGWLNRHGFVSNAYAGRVIGLPGERVAIEPERITVDGAELIEPYVVMQRDPGPLPAAVVVLQDDEYLLARDLRDGSDGEDRVFVVVSRAQILGRISFVVLPLASSGSTRSTPLLHETRAPADQGRLGHWLTEM